MPSPAKKRSSIGMPKTVDTIKTRPISLATGPRIDPKNQIKLSGQHGIEPQHDQDNA
jgi:hypothetical protein